MRFLGIPWALCLLFLLQACAFPKPNLDDPTQTDITRTFRTSYDFLYETYKDDGVRLKDIALPAIASLRELEPAMRVTTEGRFAEVLLHDQVIYRFDQPAWYAADGWAAVTRDSVWALKAASPTISATSWTDIADLVLAGAASSLNRNIGYFSRDDLKSVGLAGGDPRQEIVDYWWNDEDWAVPGFRVGYTEDVVQITQVRRKSDAAEAGLRPGDVVLAVDGKPAENYARLPVALRLLGPSGSQITVTLRRAGSDEARNVTLRRERRHLDAPVVERKNGVLYLQIVGLRGNTVDAVKEHLQTDASQSNNDLSGIILDLRGTTAGNPFAAALLHDVFYKGEGRYFDGDRDDEAYKRLDPGDGVAAEIPLVILANGATAGVAETLIADFEDSGRAIVLGSGTQGSGQFEWSFFLANGGFFVFRNKGMKTSSGFIVAERGVLPMICSADLGSRGAALSRLRNGAGHIDLATRTQAIDEADVATLKAHRDRCPPQTDQDDDDIELAAAILSDPSLYSRILETDLR